MEFEILHKVPSELSSLLIGYGVSASLGLSLEIFWEMLLGGLEKTFESMLFPSSGVLTPIGISLSWLVGFPSGESLTVWKKRYVRCATKILVKLEMQYDSKYGTWIDKWNVNKTLYTAFSLAFAHRWNNLQSVVTVFYYDTSFIKRHDSTRVSCD